MTKAIEERLDEIQGKSRQLIALTEMSLKVMENVHEPYYPKMTDAERVDAENEQGLLLDHLRHILQIASTLAMDVDEETGNGITALKADEQGNTRHESEVSPNDKTN